MKRVVGVLVAAIFVLGGCTGSHADPNEPTPNGTLSARCAALLDLYERAKAQAEASASDQTEGAVETAQAKLSKSGCLKS
jgi:hypothetical protein